MIDPKDLLLREHFVKLCVQADRRFKVHAEGLLHDDPGTLHQPGLIKHLHRRQRSLRRHAQVVESLGLNVERPLCPLDGCGQRLGARCCWHKIETFSEARPIVFGEPSGEELVHG